MVLLGECVSNSLAEFLVVTIEGLDEQHHIVDGAKKAKDDWGFDADAGVWGHMLERGIVDPAKVTRAAVENAASVAGLLLTTEAAIAELPEEAPPMADPHGHHGGEFG